MKITYSFDTDCDYYQSWLGDIERGQDDEIRTRISHAAEELRKYRLKDSISSHYDLGYYDGIERALEAIEQALKD